jgi:magnesium-transporting ATPase (P-type)
MDDPALAKLVDATAIFAKLSPPQKARVIAAL